MRPSFLKGLACALLLFMMLVVCSESKKGRKQNCKICMENREKMKKEEEKTSKKINGLMESCKPVPKQIQQLFSKNKEGKRSSQQIKEELKEVERKLRRIVGSKKCTVKEEIKREVRKFQTYKMISTMTRTKKKTETIIFKRKGKKRVRKPSVKRRRNTKKIIKQFRINNKVNVTRKKELEVTLKKIENSRKQCAVIPPKCKKIAERLIRRAARKVLQNSGKGQGSKITRRKKELIVAEAQNILENEPETSEGEEDEPEPNKILAISEPQSLQRPPAPPIPIPTTIITLLETTKKSIEDFFTEQEDDKEMDTMDEIQLKTFVLIIKNYRSALEEAVISVSNNDEKKVQQLMKDCNNLYRTKLIEILNNPSENGRQLLNYVFSYENLKTTDYIINFIWQMIEETVVNEDDPDQPESQEIFDSNTLILCEEENLAGIACYYVDVTKSCITDKENKKVLNVENMKIKSIFAPQGMYLTIKKKEKVDRIRRLRGPHVWSHQNLFDGAEKIIIQTQEQFSKTNPTLRMNELDFYFINFRTTTNKEDKVGKNVTNEGTNCFKQCGRTGGACPVFCGEGVCCRKFWNNEPGCENAENPCEGYHCCSTVSSTASDSKTKNGPFGDWTDTISKHSICVRGRKDNGGKKIIKGVPVDESSINIYVPDGVRVKLKNTQCRNKGINKKEEKKENVTTIKGPQWIDLQDYPEVHKVILLNAAKDDNEERNEDDDIIDPPTDGDNDEEEDDDEDDDDEDDQMSYCTKDDDCVYGKTISELLNQVGKPNRMLGSKIYVNVTIPDGCYLETHIAPTTGKKKANEDVCEIPVPSIRGEITKTMTEMLNIFEKKQRDIKLKCDDDEDDDDDDDDDKEGETIKDDGTNKSAQRKSYLMTYGSPEFVASNPNFDAPNLMVEEAYTKGYHKSTNHHPFHPRRKHQQNAQI